MNYSAGESNFRGHEFDLETENLVCALHWNSYLNVTMNRNEAMKLSVNNAT